eukprot:9499470-Pyramimonas_sp.AAC.1
MRAVEPHAKRNTLPASGVPRGVLGFDGFAMWESVPEVSGRPGVSGWGPVWKVFAGLEVLTPTPRSAVCLLRGKSIPISVMVVRFWLPG